MKWIIKPIKNIIDWCFNQGKLGKFIAESGLLLATVMGIFMFTFQLIGVMVRGSWDLPPWFCFIPLGSLIVFHILRVLFIVLAAIITLAWFGIDRLNDKIKKE